MVIFIWQNIKEISRQTSPLDTFLGLSLIVQHSISFHILMPNWEKQNFCISCLVFWTLNVPEVDDRMLYGGWRFLETVSRC